jgi:hypothetical protein
LVVVVEGEVEGEEVVDFVLEAGVALPAGEGVGVDAEGLGDDGGGVAEKEEAGGGALDGFERAGGGARMDDGRWKMAGWSGFVLRRRRKLLRLVARCCAGLRGRGTKRDGRDRVDCGGDGSGEGGVVG